MCGIGPIVEIDDDCLLTITKGSKTLFPIRLISISEYSAELEMADGVLDVNKEEVNDLQPSFKTFFENWMNCKDLLIK